MLTRLAAGLPALAGGVLQAMALSPWAAGWHAWLPALLQSSALCLLLLGLTKAASPRHGALLAWLHGTVWLVGATGWLFVSLHDFGGLPTWLSALAVAVLSGALAIYMAVLGALWVRWRSGACGADAALLAGLWLLAELARALIFTGFPWGASAYALIDTPLDALAPWLGVYGLGALWAGLVAWAFLSALAHRRLRARAMVAWLALPVLCLVLARVPQPQFTQAHGKPLRVALLQGNVPQDEKFDHRVLGAMLQWHAEQLTLASARGVDLVVAPETAIPLLPDQLPEGYWDALVAAFGPGRSTSALIGVPLGSLDNGYSNSVVGLSPGQAEPYRYDKHHLVPFGEFIPLGFRWFVNMMNMPLGDFTRGPLAAPSFEVHEQRIAPTICYEDLFGEELAARFRDPVAAPTLFANVSNLAWFGDTVAIFQHLQIARMRSLEFQLPTVRATNTGATVLIEASGEVSQRLPGQTRGVLPVTVQGRNGRTPFAIWAAALGLWPLVLAGLLATLPAIQLRRLGGIH